MKWSPHRLNDTAVLAVVDAVGRLSLYAVIEKEDQTLELQALESLEVVEDGLALSLDWSTRKQHSESPLITVSDSKGRVNILQVSTANWMLCLH